MRSITFVAMAAFLIPCWSARSARPEEPPGAPLADRAKILRTEMRRGPAADLAPYLAPDTNPALRKQAIRALGRIGDRAGATQWLVKLLGGGADLIDVLRAAGLSGAEELESPVTGHLTSKDPLVQAEALYALGWIASASVGGYGSPQVTSDVAVRVAAKAASMLHSTSVIVRAAALEALALAGQEAYLERALAYADPMEEAEIQDAAAFAVWFLARARRTAAKAQMPDWPGDFRYASYLMRWTQTDLVTRRLDAVRPIGILAPLKFSADDALLAHLGALLNDPDPRVVQETIARVFTTRKGPAIDALLGKALSHADTKVRQAAAEALGEHGTPEAVAALGARLKEEKDERLQIVLGGALTKAGKDMSHMRYPGSIPPQFDPRDQAQREVRILKGSKDPKVLDSLVARVEQEKDAPLLVLELLGALEEHKSPVMTAFVGKCLGHADPYVRASAVDVIGKQLLTEHLASLDQVLVDADTLAERDVREYVVKAWIEFAKADTTDEDRRSILRTRLLEVAHNDPAFTARAYARKACKEMNLEGCPDKDPLQPNDWRGLPRPKAPVLGLDLTKGGPWLDEAEILQLADRMAAEKPEFVVENRFDDTWSRGHIDPAGGMFRMAIDPGEAPVHAVSFLLAVVGKVYEGTLWHRVVPSFVIQGGDPHGDGSGDAGWSVPDEITRARFTRGALGMPKGEVRDTGGCQLFVMHSDYRPLDGRYTCYGRVVDGMDTVDRIRVGDRITAVRIVLSQGK